MFRRILQKLHRLLGISAGAVVFVLALSGSILVFDEEIDLWLNPELLSLAPQEKPVSLDAALAVVRAELPQHKVAFIRLPRTPESPVEIWSSDEPHQIAYVDPYRLKLLGTRGENDGAMGILKNLHVRLFAGEAGHTGVGIAGLALLFLLGSGATLAWRKGRLKRIFKPRLKGPAPAIAFDWHRFIGTAGWALLFISAVTGVMLVFFRVTAFALMLAFGGTPPERPGPVELAADRALLSLDEMKPRAEAAMPEATLTWMSPPEQEGAPFLARYRHRDDPHPNGTSFAAFHPQTGELLSVYSWENKGTGLWLSDLKYPIHIGAFWGPAGPFIVVLTGLLPIALMGTGGYLWVRRRLSVR